MYQQLKWVKLVIIIVNNADSWKSTDRKKSPSQTANGGDIIIAVKAFKLANSPNSSLRYERSGGTVKMRP